MAHELANGLDPEGSILFLGSGFTHAAKNIRGTNPPTGEGLKSELAAVLGISEGDYNLQILADEAATRPEIDLYQILYQLYTICELVEEQKDVLRLPWHRIYTTNYDDAIELFYLDGPKTTDSYTFDDKIPEKLKPGSIIHLHGMIKNATRENILRQLVLNESSYVDQYSKSLWYVEFSHDIEFCRSCYFVGYSLSDGHISAILSEDPNAKAKTYFITKKEPDRISANRLERYGKIWPIRVGGFAQQCRDNPRRERSHDPHGLQSFLYLDPFKDKKTLAPPTATEIFNLVTYGTFNYARCLSTLPKPEYVVPRYELAQDAVRELEDVECLLVHSRIGNGKTIFLHIMAYLLSQRDYKCFWVKPHSPWLQQDVETLRRMSGVIVFFDSYTAAVDLKRELEEVPGVKFVVAVRTALQEVRLHEIQSRLPAPLARVSLNGIREEEARDFERLLDKSGVRAPGLEGIVDEAQDFRDVVVSLYGNAEVKKKIGEEFGPLLADDEFKNAFAVSHILKWAGYDVDGGFLRSVTQRDPYVALAKYREIAGDIFVLDNDNIGVRSSLFAEYLIRNHLTTADIVDSVYTILTQVVRRKTERRYRAILSSLMRFSNLQSLVEDDPNHMRSLRSLYERLARDVEMNREPLFWLQYCILMTYAGNLGLAEGLIRTAYSRAADSEGFKPFQIDTYALKLFLLIEEQDKEGASVVRFEEILEKIERVREMIGEASRRDHAVQVLNGIEPFVMARSPALSRQDKNALLYHIDLVMENLGRVPADEHVETGVSKVRSSLIRAKSLLLDAN